MFPRLSLHYTRVDSSRSVFHPAYIVLFRVMTSLRTLQHPVDDMPELPEGHGLQIWAHIGLPKDTDKATLKVVRIPFQNHDFPGQWFYGLRFSLAILSSQKSHLHELLTIACLPASGMKSQSCSRREIPIFQCHGSGIHRRDGDINQLLI
jgi:hypothetical protein